MTWRLRKVNLYAAAVGLIALLGCKDSLLHPMPPLLAPSCEPAPSQLGGVMYEDRAEMSWASDMSSVDHFVVERAGPDGIWGVLAQVDADTRSYVDTTVEAGGYYDYRVRAVRSTCTTEPSVELRLYAAPLSPESFGAEGRSDSTVALTWESPNAHARGFRLERRADAEIEFTIAQSYLATDTLVHVDDGLIADTQYHYRLITLGEGDLDSPPAEASAWTLPGAPGDFAVSAFGPDHLDLSWSAVANPHLEGFRLERSPAGAGSFVEVASLSADARSHSDDSLSEESGYDYQLYALAGNVVSQPASLSAQTSFAPRLDWGGPPSLDSSCLLQVEANAELDVASGASFAAATASVSHTSSALSADASGFSAVLEAPAPGTIQTGWGVLDSLGGASYLTRDLLLSALPIGIIGAFPSAPTARLGDDSADGRQPLRREQERPPPGSCGGCFGRRGSLALGPHSCALQSDAGVRCWGRNNNGQLGDGTAVERHHPAAVCAYGSDATSDCIPLGGAVSVVSGREHSCSLRINGGVYCWGLNDQGRLGDGSNMGRLNPVEVCASGSQAGGNCVPLSGAVDLVAGARHNCALLGDGSVHCWGDNFWGALGNGSSGLFQNALNPGSVCRSGVLADGTCLPVDGMVGLAAGLEHSCAIDAGGGVQCWGYNDKAQLGNGASSTHSHHPTRVCAAGSVGGGDCESLGGVAALAAGSGFTCALMLDRGVQCWGEGHLTGDGIPGGGRVKANPSPVCAAGSADTGDCAPLTDVVAITAGFHHSCAMLATGEVKCWGWNPTGALGNGQANFFEVQVNPVDVCASGSTQNNDCVPLTGVAAYAGGEAHSCGLLWDGSMRCVGGNGNGQIGDGFAGAQQGQLNPVPVCLDGFGVDCQGGQPVQEAAVRRCAELEVSLP